MARPNPSRRKRAIVNLVALLATIKPANGYVTDLSGVAAVGKSQETMQVRRELGLPYVVRVRDGAEAADRRGAHKSTISCSMALVVEVLARRSGDVALVDLINEAIADIRYAVDNSAQLSGAVDDCWVAEISDPDYDFDGQTAVVAVVVTALYDYMQGTEI